MSVEKDRSSLRKIVRNSATVAVLFSAAAFTKIENVNAESYLEPELPKNPASSLSLPRHPVLSQIEDQSIFDQADPFLETTTGRAVTAAAVAFTLARGLYTLQKSIELDNKKKLAEAIVASALAFSLSATLFADSLTDVEKHVPAALLFAWSLAQADYNRREAKERDRKLRKRGSAYASSAALFSLGLITLIDSLR